MLFVNNNTLPYILFLYMVITVLRRDFKKKELAKNAFISLMVWWVLIAIFMMIFIFIISQSNYSF